MGWLHLAMLRAHSWLCTQEILLAVLRVSYGILWIEPISATCNANTLPAAQLLWPLLLQLYHLYYPVCIVHCLEYKVPCNIMFCLTKHFWLLQILKQDLVSSRMNLYFKIRFPYVFLCVWWAHYHFCGACVLLLALHWEITPGNAQNICGMGNWTKVFFYKAVFLWLQKGPFLFF